MVLNTLLKILQNDSLIGRARQFRACKNLLNLGCKNNSGFIHEVVKRLHAKAVPRAEQLALFAIPNREGPHAIKSIYAGRAPLTISSKDNFRVRVGTKRLSHSLQLFPNFKIV